MTVVNPKSISGINSITTGSGSDNLLTIHTSDASSTERVRINSSGDVIVGSGITVSPDGDIFATGVTTSTTFVGNLTGNVTVSANNSTDETVYPVFVDGTGSKALESDTSLTYNPSSNNLTAGTFIGAISGTTGTFSSHVSLGDSDELRFGDATGGDLKIYHDGNNSAINDVGTGSLYIQGSDNIYIRDYDTSENHIVMTKNGAVDLYHNGTKKFETTSSGATLTGDLYATSRLLVNTTDAGESNGDEATFANTGGNAGITIRSAVDAETKIYFSEGTSGGSQYRGAINYNHNTNYMAFSANETEKMRILSGGGITFNGDTATANALDDYEEGSFTPKLGGNSNSSTYYVDGTGTYIKIGRQISVSIRFNAVDLNNSSAGDAKIFNLPFSAGLQPTNGVTAVTNNVQYYNVPFGTDYISNWYLSSGTTSWQGLVSRSNTTWTAFPASDFHAANVYINFFGTYFTS